MALDLNAVRAGACHPDCATIYAPSRRHAPECRADDILELVDEVERFRAAVNYALRTLTDTDRTLGGPIATAYEVLRVAIDGESWPCPTATTAVGGGE